MCAQTSNEEWRGVAPEFDALGAYEVSNLGRVRRVAKPRMGPFSAGRSLKPYPTGAGYLSVEINYRCLKVHQIVARAFLGPCPENHQVNHRDGDKNNNSAANLEYITHDENMRHAAKNGLMQRGTARPGAKLQESDVRAIRAARGIVKQSDLAAQYGVCAAYISVIQTRRKWAWVS